MPAVRDATCPAHHVLTVTASADLVTDALY
jgi:hypothetical protein